MVLLFLPLESFRLRDKILAFPAAELNFFFVRAASRVMMIALYPIRIFRRSLNQEDFRIFCQNYLDPRVKT